MYEFYVAQRILEETASARCLELDECKTMLSMGLLRNDLDILSLVAEHVMEVSVELQHLLYYECWYRSVLMTRKIFRKELGGD